MILENNTNYYEVLEINPDATPNDIRQSYLRLKMAYSKDSVALYTIVSKEETDDILLKIEEAYQVLSNEEKRREYDRNSHHEMDEESPFSVTARRQKEAVEKVVSIDRVPPMDRSSREEDLLVAPVTDFASSMANISATGHAAAAAAAVEASSPAPQPIKLVRGKEVARGTALDPQLEEEIARETEWPGQLLHKIREARRISIEEMADFTKISKTYLFAIENEDYTKLPAATFVRGFVMQVAKRLKLPHEKVAAAYVSRYRKTCPDKS